MPRMTQVQRKAPEAVTAQVMSKVLGIPALPEIEAACAFYCENSDGSPWMADIIRRVYGLYTWVCDIDHEILQAGTSPLAEHLMTMPGQLFVVRDSTRASQDSIWLAVADPDPDLRKDMERIPHRGFTRGLRIGDSEEISHIIAIQLSSCQP